MRQKRAGIHGVLICSQPPRRLLWLAGLAFLYCAIAAADFADTAKNLSRYTLDNGLTLLVYRRPDVRTVEVNLSVNAGSVDEEQGRSGCAHLLEHMAFKGTKIVGTTNFEQEQAALRRVEDARTALMAAQEACAGETRIHELEEAFIVTQEAAEHDVVYNDYARILERAGAIDVNAATWYDNTEYTCTLPAPQLSLWMKLESDRIANAVFREFYVELDVVKEEWREGHNNPLTRFNEELQEIAMIAHPYRRPIIGFWDDVEKMRTADIEAFYHRYMIASNIVVVVIGDLEPQAVYEMAATSFGTLPGQPKPQKRHTAEPEQQSEKQFVMKTNAQPVVAQAYHIPGFNHENFPSLQLLCYLLGDGHNSRLYKELVLKQHLAVEVEAYTNELNDNQLFFLSVTPAEGVDPHEVDARLDDIVQAVCAEPVPDEELAAAKHRMKADQLFSWESSSNLAEALVSMEFYTGDAAHLFTVFSKLDAITPQSLMVVAQHYFIPANRTTGFLLTEGSPGDAQTEPEEAEGH